MGAFGAQGDDLLVQRATVAEGGAAQLDGDLAGAAVTEGTGPIGATAPDPSGAAIQRANSQRPASETV